MRSGSLTVHTLTAGPRMCSLNSDGHQRVVRVDAVISWATPAIATPDRRCEEVGDGIVGRRRTRSSVSMLNEDQGARRPEIRLDETGNRVGDEVIGVVIRVGRQVLDLDVDAKALAGFERLGQTGDELGQFLDGKLGEETTILELGIVVHHGDAVGGAPHIELNPLRPELSRQAKSRKGVLASGFACASVGDHGGGRCHGFQSFTSPCHSSVLPPDLGTCLRRGSHTSQKKRTGFTEALAKSRTGSYCGGRPGRRPDLIPGGESWL